MKLGPLRSTSVHLAYPENQIRHPERPGMLDDGPWRRGSGGARRGVSQLRQHVYLPSDIDFPPASVGCAYGASPLGIRSRRHPGRGIDHATVDWPTCPLQTPSNGGRSAAPGQKQDPGQRTIATRRGIDKTRPYRSARMARSPPSRFSVKAISHEGGAGAPVPVPGPLQGCAPLGNNSLIMSLVRQA